MSFSTKRKAFVDWLKAVSGYTEGKVIWLDQDAPRPTNPYISIRMTSFVERNREFVHTPDSTGKAAISTHKEFTLNIHAYGTSSVDPIELLLNILDSVRMETVKEIFRLQEIVFVKTLMGPTNTTIKLDTSFEKRGSMDLLFRIPWVVEDTNKGLINAVSVEGLALKPSGNTISVINFNIP